MRRVLAYTKKSRCIARQGQTRRGGCRRWHLADLSGARYRRDGTPIWWAEVETEEEAFDLIDRYTVDGGEHYFKVEFNDSKGIPESSILHETEH